MITLSIVSHRQAPLVATLLDDLAGIASPLVASIIVTRNVEEPTLAWPASLATRIVTIANASPRGFGANHSAAFARCTTPYFAVMNPDLRLPTDPFPALVAAFDSRRGSRTFTRDSTLRTGLVAPRIVSPSGAPEDAARVLITPLELLRRLAGARTAPTNPDWLAGMFFLVASDAFRAVGGFDERYFMYCEDFDLCARLRLSGWSFRVVDEASVVHAAQRASHRSFLHLRWHLTSFAKMWASATFWRYRRMLDTAAR